MKCMCPLGAHVLTNYRQPLALIQKIKWFVILVYCAIQMLTQQYMHKQCVTTLDVNNPKTQGKIN